jgi:uncharacterized protein
VEDAATTVTKIKAAGGWVFAEPFDVMGEGTMAVVADPSGATFGLWQPGRHQGFEVKDVPGSVCWVELSTRNLAAAEAFYRDVFGWDPTDSSVPGAKYTVFKFDGTQIGGAQDMPEMVPQDVPSYWLVYFAVADADDTAAKTKQLGGRELVPPTDIPGTGRFAVLQDPQGGSFGLLQAPAPEQANG